MTMIQRYGFYLFSLVWTLTACSDHLDEDMAEENICLNVSVGDIESTSRAAEPYKGATPTTNNKLNADVWFSTTSGEYAVDETDANTHLPCRTHMSFDGTLQYAFNSNSNNLKYPTDDSQVYCVGLYPQDVWESKDNTTATATFDDGSKDLMFAGQINGKQTDPLSSKTLNFEHLLTWLKVCICATSQEAAAAWGDVTSISIDSDTKATVTLSSGDVVYDTQGSIVTFDENSKDFDNLKKLHTTIKEVGSVCCSPALKNTEGRYTYTVYVTVGGKTIKKEITLLNENGTPFTGDSTKGKLFILALYFNPYDVVEGVCTLTAWNAQNEDLYFPTTTTNN